MALYSVVNGPERSSRFYVFYNESIYITVLKEVQDSMSFTMNQYILRS